MTHIKKEKDAQGAGFEAALKDGKNYIIERDDGYIESASIHACEYIATYKNWPSRQKKCVKYAKGKVLDIGCGPGRHALYLQKKGLDVTGLDNSPSALSLAKKLGLKKTKLMSINELGKLKQKSFNTILMLGNNFGLFEGAKKIKAHLKKIDRIATDDALIIAESRNPYKTSKKVHKEYHVFNKKRGRMPGQLRIRIRYQKLKGLWIDYLFVSPKEMGTLLRGTNWKIKKLIEPKRNIFISVLEKRKAL